MDFLLGKVFFVVVSYIKGREDFKDRISGGEEMFPYPTSLVWVSRDGTLPEGPYGDRRDDEVRDSKKPTCKIKFPFITKNGCCCCFKVRILYHFLPGNSSFSLKHPTTTLTSPLTSPQVKNFTMTFIVSSCCFTKY